MKTITKKEKRITFKGISLETKWKNKSLEESFQGSKAGGKFMKTVIDYRG